MRKNISLTEKEVKFFIVVSMLFAIFETLSIELNDFFKDINIFGYNLAFNPSVIFFCIGFFIIDLVTEIYNDKFANYLIYAKLLSQVVFIIFGVFGVMTAGIEHGQIAQTFFLAPRILFNSMLSSFIGYKLTGKIMQILKIKFKGRFLLARYLSSTFPGEIVFSLVFSLLSFSHGKSSGQMLNIFAGLILVKFSLSLIFSLFVVPVTNVLKHYLKINLYGCDEVSSIPFQKN